MNFSCGCPGSASGGEWVPKKEKDKKFLGEPGQINEMSTKYGDKYETLIGKDGRAIVERHWTDHNQPYAHTKPHDHVIDWSKGHPEPGKAINYPDGDYPDLSGFLSEKSFILLSKGEKSMIYAFDEDQFESLSDFKWCIHCGGEVQFDYQGASYSVTHIEDGIIISKARQEETSLISPDIEDILNYLMDDGKKLREVITEVEVTERTI